MSGPLAQFKLKCVEQRAHSSLVRASIVFLKKSALLEKRESSGIPLLYFPVKTPLARAEKIVVP